MYPNERASDAFKLGFRHARDGVGFHPDADPGTFRGQDYRDGYDAAMAALRFNAGLYRPERLRRRDSWGLPEYR
jgi:hypothetical protein